LRILLSKLLVLFAIEDILLKQEHSTAPIPFFIIT